MSSPHNLTIKFDIRSVACPVCRPYLACNVTQWPFYALRSQAPAFGIFYGCLQNRQHFIAYVMFDIAKERYLKRLPRKKREEMAFCYGTPPRRSILWVAIVCFMCCIFISTNFFGQGSSFFTQVWVGAMPFCVVVGFCRAT